MKDIQNYDQISDPRFGPTRFIVEIINNIENFIHDEYLSKGVHLFVSCGSYCQMILKEAHEAVNLHKTGPLLLYTIGFFHFCLLSTVICPTMLLNVHFINIDKV